MGNILTVVWMDIMAAYMIADDSLYALLPLLEWWLVGASPKQLNLRTDKAAKGCVIQDG